MAIINTATLLEVEKHHRVDSEYFSPEYASIEKKILQSKSYTNWGRIDGRFITGPFGSEFKVENYVKEGIFRYIRGRDVKEFFLLDDDNVYIPKKDFERLFKYALQEGDILISVVGTLGQTAIVDKNVTPAIFSCKSTVYRTRSINPFYLISYLNCKFGRKLLQRKVRGAVQTGLNIGDLKSLMIFLPNQKLQNKIGNIVINAKESYDFSKLQYTQAENLFLQELKLIDFKPKYKLFYSINLLNAFGFHRIDAEYFQPAYAKLIKKVDRNIELIPLIKFLLSIQKGIEVGSDNYENEGKPFIRVSNLSVEGFVERDQKYISEELYKQLESIYEPQEGDFLLTKDATPGIAYVLKEPAEGIISSGILKLKINEKEINKEYLALCINSILGRLQIERDGGGSVITHWKPEQVKRLLIPVLPDKTQQKIASLIKKSHKARKESKELLELAKRTVEIAIEKNEKEALNFISKFEYK